MPIINHMQTKRVSATVPGELVAFTMDSGLVDYALIVNHRTDRSVFIAVIGASTGPRTPHFTVANEGELCVSFGSDWLFEVMPPRADEGFGVANDLTVAGRAILEGENVMLVFRKDPHDIRGSGGTLDLRTRTIANPDFSESVAVKRWQVWANPETRADERGKPLIRYGFGGIDDDEDDVDE